MSDAARSLVRPRHLRFANATPTAQRKAAEQVIRESPQLMHILKLLQRLELPDAWLTSGAVYGTIWNCLTGRPETHGIKDYDLIYFDNSDLSYEAEDRQIQRLRDAAQKFSAPLELRNQARVHLWFEKRFGVPYPQLKSATESLRYYASETHAIAVQLTGENRMKIEAPFGLNNIFSFRLIPNRTLENAKTHMSKGKRIQAAWPEVERVHW